jgi:hypothetical protein
VGHGAVPLNEIEEIVAHRIRERAELVDLGHQEVADGVQP